MRQNMKLYSLIFGLFLFTSCEKLLDVDTVSDITNDDYWQSPGDMESYLFGIYDQFRNLNNNTMYFEDRGDAFVPGMEGGASNAWNQNLTDQNAPNWNSFYTVIQHCNLLLKYADRIAFGVQADKERILAETYFMRAHTYFSLLRIWGDVPLELEPTESDHKPQLGRSPKAEVMTQILNDLARSIDLFPEEGIKDKSRVSQPAAYALKADVLLWKAKVLSGTEADLAAVIDAADKASLGTSLEDDFGKIFGDDSKKGKEIIFSIYMQRDEKGDQYSSQLKPRDVFVKDALNVDDIAFARSGARSQYAPSPKLQDAFKEYASDSRRAKSIIEAIAPGNVTIAWFDNKMRGSVNAGNRYYDSDIVLYRLAEMILFKAEALAALNRTAEAITELDKVRMRANIGNYTGATDKIAVERAILKERFREFYLELKRWPDLLRFHFGSTINVYAEVPNLSGTTVPLYSPIPKTEIDRNPNLKQTEGYSK